MFLVTRKGKKKVHRRIDRAIPSTCSIPFRNGRMKDCCKYSISYTLSYDGEPIQRGRWFYPYRFQTRLTNTDIGRYEINIGEGTVSATRLKSEGREKRNTAKYPICEGISLSLSFPLFLYPSARYGPSILLSKHGVSLRVPTRAIEHFKNEGPVLFQART